MYNLLTEPLITVETAVGDRERRTLPGVLAELSAGNIAAFPALRPHQRHPWHAFLCQLAAMALMTAEETELPVDEDSWRTLLRRLAPDWPDDEPWSLIVKNESKPAFMQPCLPEHLGNVQYTAISSDEIDSLKNSKNHDQKQSISYLENPENWVFGLISINTCGTSDSGNYKGGFRQASGYKRRFGVSFTPSPDTSTMFSRDTRALLELHEDLTEECGCFANYGCEMLLWLRVWDGIKSAYRFDEIDLYALEICRRYRLRWDGSRIVADRRKNKDLLKELSNKSKEGKNQLSTTSGAVGDPWGSTIRGENPAFLAAHIGLRRLSYSFVSDLIFGNNGYQESPLLEPRPDEEGKDGFIVIRGIATDTSNKGNGKTIGYHERVIPAKIEIQKAIGKKSKDPLLGKISESRINDAKEIYKSLSESIAIIANSARLNKNGYPDTREKLEIGYKLAENIENYIDANFFDALWVEYESSHDEQKKIRNAWVADLIEKAVRLLNSTAEVLPLPTVHYYRVLFSARRHFDRRKRDAFPDLFPVTPKTPEAPNND